MTDRFVHLHTHTEYSLLDGAARIEAPKSNPSAPTVFTEALAHDMPALAMTDHGAMFGTLKFYEAARAVGIKPIIGVEAYVAPGSRFDRTPGESEEKYYHLTLLAEDETGYRNLLKLVSRIFKPTSGRFAFAQSKPRCSAFTFASSSFSLPLYCSANSVSISAGSMSSSADSAPR